VPIHDSFESVLEAARRGAEWAWARLIRDVDATLRGYVRRQAGVDVDDLVAETWLHVARGLGSFSGDEAAFRSWVFTIAHHRIIDERRRLSRKPVEHVDDVALDAVAPSTRSAESEAVERIDDEAVRGVLDRLSPDQREVILLRLVAGFGVTEVAHIMGKAPGAVRALQRRALKRLEKILDQDGTFSA
jgi:RNA polymerase sigma-70 factor (ECF subfamily)